MITEEHFIDCFADGLQADGREVWCEASAVFYDGAHLYFANDKDMPGVDASVFYIPYDGKKIYPDKPVYFSQPALKSSHKYEDFALTPDRKHVFLTTGFDRIKSDSHEWDGYNSLLYWSSDKLPNSFSPKNTKLAQNENFSLTLRKALSKALRSSQFPEGMPYFKVEGLAATDTKLYFGIREEGKKFDDFAYKVKLVSVPYRFALDSLILSEDFQVISDINIATMHPGLPPNLALSSIEYDRARKVFWLLTSSEGENQANSAYLWWATEADLKANKMNIVNDRLTKLPLTFTNKAEDLALVAKNRLFIIHDDDRSKPKVGGVIRKPHQAAYSIVEFMTP